MADASCPGIVSNPDLVGIGPRLNFYVTIFVTGIIPWTKGKNTSRLWRELYKNAVFYGLALLITVLVQTIKGRLDLYHAIFVMHMLVFYSIHQFDGIRATWTLKYSLHRIDDRFRVRVDVVTHVIQWFGVLFIFPSWALYVWIKGSGFGSQPLCNDHVKYVFFFVSVRGTVNWLRILAIICFSLRMLSPLLLFLSTSRRLSLRGDLESIGYFSSISRLASILLAVYGIVTTELMVHRNRSHVQAGENSWGIGQVVPVLLLLPIFTRLMGALKELFSRTNSGQADSDAGDNISMHSLVRSL